MNNMLNSMKEYEKNLKKESAEYLAIENAQLEERIQKAIELLIIKQNSFGGIRNVSDVIEILRGDSNE